MERITAAQAQIMKQVCLIDQVLGKGGVEIAGIHDAQAEDWARAEWSRANP